MPGDAAFDGAGDPEMNDLAARMDVLRGRSNGHATPDDPNDEGSLGEWDAGDDNWQIPPREWLLGNIFCRKFVSSLIADGSVGKTSLRYVQAMSCATGRRLSGEYVFGRWRVLIVSFEDDANELRRRIRAVMLHYNIAADELKGWLFLAALG